MFCVPENITDSGSLKVTENKDLRHPKMWRSGPASLIYDQVGIPEDCENLDYSAVLVPRDIYLEPERDSEEQHQLDLAVQSILPHEEYTTSVFHEGTFSTDSLPQNLRTPDLQSYSLTVKHGEDNSLPQNVMDFQFQPESYDQGANGGQGQHLRQLVFELEEAAAVKQLTQELEFVHENVSFYNNDQKQKGERGENRDENQDDFSLVSQLQWENDIIWDVSEQVSDFATAKERHGRAGWVPTSSNRKVTDAVLVETNNFRSILPYENEELIDGSWEDEVIWSADEFRKNIPQPKLPVFDTADEDIVFHKPNIEYPLRVRQLSASPPKKALIQPHTMKSKLILGKTGFIPSKWKREQLEQQAHDAQEKLRSLSGPIVTCSSSQKDWTGNIFYASGDAYYASKMPTNVSIYNCRHSRLVKELVPPFVVTHLSTEQLRNFHRPKLCTIGRPGGGKYSNRHYIRSLAKRIQSKMEERDKMIAGGQQVLLDEAIDLSGRDGTIILIENSEEYPPLLSQVGMCSQIVNYYKRKSLKDCSGEYAPPLPHSFGDTNFVSGSSYFPFLGTLEGGQVLSSICNNMYLSPIYWHGKNETDFLVLRSSNSCLLIRDLDGLFVAGQQCPLIEVPEPNSNKVKTFLKEFVQAFVYNQYRTFFAKGSKNSSPLDTIVAKVRMDFVTQHFPTLQESNIKSMLKNSSELKRIGNVSWLVMKSGFKLPELEDLTEKVPVEQICAYYSLLAAEQRLRDTGFDSMLSLPDRGQDELEGKKGRKPQNLHFRLLDTSGVFNAQHQQISQSAFEEELLSAPWNTTAAFIAASKGKCFLQVTGPADPTGCGEGFSYVKVAKRGTGASGAVGSGIDSDQIPHYSGRGRPRKYPQKTGGTDADLRKLSAKTAKELLKKAGVPDKEIQKLTRWEIIDLVRTLSTEKVMQGEETDKAIAKFCRWKNIHSLAMNQERYKEACQRVFELQNKVLSSQEILSSDEEDSDEDDFESEVVGDPRHASMKDIERMGKNIERILEEDANIDRLTHEEEELERLELQKMMLGGIMAKDADIAKRKEALEQDKQLAKKSKENSEDILTDLIKHPGRFLKITRTFKDKAESFIRTEIVRDPVVIAAYIRIRSSKSEEFIKHFLQKADRRDKKEQKQKDRMLLGQLYGVAKETEYRVGRFHAKRKREMEDEYFPNKEAKKEAEKALKRQRRKCGACGILGHMKTSKDCPLYNKEKIEEILKKKEEKKQKKSQASKVVTVTSPPIQLAPQEMETEKDEFSFSESDDSDESSESLSSSDDGFTSTDEEDINVLPSQSTVSPISSQEEPIVKTDGLKMFVKKSSIQDMITLAQEQEAKEQEVARILATMALEGRSSGTPTSAPRRRISQAERENADYLSDRKYKTTAADRRSTKL